MLGRDWTHLGVAKLYTDIAANGYHMLYLTSRSVGQADTTRNYLNGIVQDKFKLPKGPVIMSPDRTMAALKRLALIITISAYILTVYVEKYIFESLRCSRWPA